MLSETFIRQNNAPINNKHILKYLYILKQSFLLSCPEIISKISNGFHTLYSTVNLVALL